MCEIEPYARAVLRKNFPGVPIFDDVRTLKAADLPAKIDVITGGFPCQDISLAGKGAGITGARSGLWVEMFRVIDEVRPSWVVVENVSALRSRGLDTVLGALASIGYDAEWHCIPASAVGAPHRRDRVWIVAHANGNDQQWWSGSLQVGRLWGSRQTSNHGDAARIKWRTEPDVGRVAHGIPRRVDRLKGLGNAVVPQIPEMIARAIRRARTS